MEGEEAENAQLSDAEAAALQSNSDEGDFIPKDKNDNRPHSRARERIQELAAQKKQAYAELQAERLAKQELVEKIKSLEGKIDSVSAKANEKPGVWDKYSDSDLAALKVQYLDPQSENHSPAMAVKIEEERFSRLEKRLEQKQRTASEMLERTRNENQRVYNETRALLGEAASELDNSDSPLAKLARQRYIEAAQQYGQDHVVNNPVFQRDAILRAYAELQKAGAAQKPNREAETLRQRMVAKEALSANGEAAVEELSAVRSALSKRDFKKAYSELPILKQMAADIDATRGRRR